VERCELVRGVAIGQCLRREDGEEEDKKDSEVGFEECQDCVEGFRVAEALNKMQMKRAGVLLLREGIGDLLMMKDAATWRYRCGSRPRHRSTLNGGKRFSFPAAERLRLGMLG
jgi:hypothetical protein